MSAAYTAPIIYQPKKYFKMKKFLSLSIFFLCANFLISQNYDIRLNRTSFNCTSRQVCYDVQFRPNGPVAPFYLSGQNYRLFYDGSKADYTSGTSLLPTPTYTSLVVVQDIQSIDASAVNGPLSFEQTLSFLNLYIDLSDLNSGAILLPAGQWTSTANLCFTVSEEVIEEPNTCVDFVWGREEITELYATAYMAVARWISPTEQAEAVGVLYDDLNNADGDAACLNEACALSQITVADITVNENVGNAMISVCINEPAPQNVSLVISTQNGTASSPSDYTLMQNVSLVISAGQTCASLMIPIINDTVFEPNESFTVNLSSPSSNAVIAVPTATVTIIDNDEACAAQAPVISGN